MSASDRGERTAIVDWVFPGVGIVLATLLAWGIGYLQARETERRYYTPRQYQESAKAQAHRACVGMKPAAMFECVDEHVEAAYQQANAEQDLSAQQRAAFSGLVAAVVSALALMATGIGIYYVRETLKATLKAVEDTSEATEAMREANVIARDSAERQLRAYIFLDEAGSIGPFTFAVGEPPHGLVNIKNYGQTPAYDVVCQRGCIVGPWPIPDDFEFPADDTGRFSGGTTLAPGVQTSFPIYKEGMSVMQAEFDEIISGASTLYVWGRIKYRDVMNVPRHTNFCLGVDINTVSNELGARRSHRHNDVN